MGIEYAKPKVFVVHRSWCTVCSTRERPMGVYTDREDAEAQAASYNGDLDEDCRATAQVSELHMNNRFLAE